MVFFFYKKHFKKSLFFDVFMKLGSVIFTVLKMKQQKKTIRKIEAYIVFSKEELNLKLNKKVTYLSSFELFKGAIEKDNKNVEIILIHLVILLEVMILTIEVKLN